VRQSVSASSAVLVGLAGASAVLLGAFGAHGLKGILDARHHQIWETAVNYQFWHALALAMVVMLAARSRARITAIVAWAMGIVMFSGSLYALALGAPRWTGMITPLGGVAFVVGWIAFAFALRPPR
jgi:uncharacterized membrane protein YgdD (TMEM256/DUF423 family)